MKEPHIASDEKQVKERADKVKLRRENQQLDLKRLLELPEFRRFAWRLMNETCGLFRDPTSGNGTIQSTNIGMQNVARLLFVELESVDPLVIPRLMTEHHESMQAEKVRKKPKEDAE